MRTAKTVAVMLLAVLCLGMTAFFVWKIVSTQLEYKAGDDLYEEIAQIAVSHRDNTEDTEEPEEDSASSAIPVESETEGADTEEVSTVDFTVLEEINSDITAWLYSPNTVIDYPVVQGTDNSYYLTHLADGTYNRNGCLFIDYKNAGDFSDANTIIYGHHMASGSMFASLINYASQEYYEAHPVMYLTLNGEQYRLELFAGYTTTVDSSAYTMTFADSSGFAQWLREICKKSDFLANMELTTDDHIVTLSTCAYSFQNARYVVHGRLVKINE